MGTVRKHGSSSDSKRSTDADKGKKNIHISTELPIRIESSHEYLILNTPKHMYTNPNTNTSTTPNVNLDTRASIHSRNMIRIFIRRIR